jgi:sigma-E processing peptidase SpoIIGA
MQYEIYIDVFFLTNFVIDFLALLFAGGLNKRRGSLYRLTASAMFGSVSTVLLFLSLPSFLIYQLLVHLLVHPLMLLIAWKRTGRFDFLRDYLMVYLHIWLLGGLLNWGLSLSNDAYFWIWVMAGCGSMAVVIRLVEERKAKGRIFSVLLQTSERNLPLKGLWDTGNLLTDPLGNRPVHIIQEELLSQELNENKLSIRLIPYRSLGQEHGLLPVVTLKGMYIQSLEKHNKQTEVPIYIEKPVLGLAKEKLFEKKEYQIILNAKSF